MAGGHTTLDAYEEKVHLIRIHKRNIQRAIPLLNCTHESAYLDTSLKKNRPPRLIRDETQTFNLCTAKTACLMPCLDTKRLQGSCAVFSTSDIHLQHAATILSVTPTPNNQRKSAEPARRDQTHYLYHCTAFPITHPWNNDSLSQGSAEWRKPLESGRVSAPVTEIKNQRKKRD